MVDSSAAGKKCSFLTALESWILEKSRVLGSTQFLQVSMALLFNGIQGEFAQHLIPAYRFAPAFQFFQKLTEGKQHAKKVRHSSLNLSSQGGV